MAEGPGGEKTEQPTAKKRSDTRKEGNVPQSKEVTTAVTLLISFYGFRAFYKLISEQMISVIKDYIGMIPEKSKIDMSDIKIFCMNGFTKYAISCIPLLLIVGIAAAITTAVQTKGLVTFKNLKPKFDRMNPLKGLKKFFSVKGFIEVLKSLIKIILLIAVIYISIKDKLQSLPKLIDANITDISSFTSSVIFDIIKKVVIAFTVIAAADYMYQRYTHEKNLKMTKQEVKEEYKNTEGDPQIKGKIKAKQQEISRRRMLQEVPSADVVIKNPTHFAVALKYDADKSAAPVVVAKGQDYLALKIIQIAEENDVSVVENIPLARALYASVEVSQEIPGEFYGAVAEILARIYSLKKKDLK